MSKLPTSRELSEPPVILYQEMDSYNMFEVEEELSAETNIKNKTYYVHKQRIRSTGEVIVQKLSFNQAKKFLRNKLLNLSFTERNSGIAVLNIKNIKLIKYNLDDLRSVFGKDLLEEWGK